MVAENLAGKKGHVNYEALPWVIYTWPEIAWVGKSEEALKAQGVEVKTGRFMFKPNGRAKAMNEADGQVKFIADARTDKILGVFILGPNASELVAEAAIAMEFGASAEDIARSFHAHPTLAEVMKEAAMDVDKRSLHS
jgi:dihydrolipoamide dehydrogenase